MAEEKALKTAEEAFQQMFLAEHKRHHKALQRIERYHRLANFALWASVAAVVVISILKTSGCTS